jgi:hypothetical protein
MNETAPRCSWASTAVEEKIEVWSQPRVPVSGPSGVSVNRRGR